MSPPLLFAMCLPLAMLIATYIVGVYEPTKLLGGVGVLSLLGSGLLAAPALLRVQGESIEPAWRRRWYDTQRSAVATLRVSILITHRIIVMAQVAMLGVVVGTATSGDNRAWASVERLVVPAIVAAMVGFALSHTLWVWAPRQRGEGPIGTDALASHERELLRLAGWALVVGGLCSLAAVLTP